jgi:glycosyltransferase involved in cell wall biosynthesis
MTHSSLIPDVGVIALVVDDWGQEWMSRHQILTRLAKYFQVVWVNPSHDWRHTFRRPDTKDLPAFSLDPGFQVYEAEFWLPRFYKPRLLAEYTFRKRLHRARELLLARGCRKIILYVWRPEFAASLDAVKYDLSCYHIVDEYTFSDVDLPNSDQEKELLKRVDQVFVHTPALLEKKGLLNSCVSLVPNGVAYQSFAASLPEPAALRAIPHPRIGYAGYLKKTLDWNLLSDLSNKHPDYSFVFVGAKKNEETTVRAVQELSRRPNVHFLGRVTTAQMSHFPQHFDVCMMPYLLNDYTNYVYPLKLHEYLASGTPVVASPTRLLKEFRGTIQLCSGAQEWSIAISNALQPQANSPEAREIRQAVARKHDWDFLVNSIARVFCRRLHLDHPELENRASAVRDSTVILSSCP